MLPTASVSEKRIARSGPLVSARPRSMDNASVDRVKSWQEHVTARVALLRALIRRAMVVKQSAHEIDAALIRAAVDQLPAIHQEVLRLQVTEDCSITEISSALNLPHSEVRTHLLLARHQIRKLCGEDTRLDPEV
jgi:DNA-directed RNA polymerase specialized sigma24 family protein